MRAHPLLYALYMRTPAPQAGSQYLGNPGPDDCAQLMTVRLVVYAMATNPNPQSTRSE